MMGDSDIDDEKPTKPYEYNDKNLPNHLTDPNYYFNIMDIRINEGDLVGESDDEVIVKRINEEQTKKISKEKTHRLLNLLEVINTIFYNSIIELN